MQYLHQNSYPIYQAKTKTPILICLHLPSQDVIPSSYIPILDPHHRKKMPSH